MGFQWGYGLWFALALPVIVLFYLFKRKYTDTPVSSHMLWSRAYKDMEANRPWQKLRSRLLLALQLLAAALAMLALAGFFMWRSDGAGKHIIYVLDGSASMGAYSGGGQEPDALSRWEAAKTAIRAHAGEEGAGAAKSLVLLSSAPVVLLSHESSQTKLAEALEQAELAWGEAAYRETLSLAAAMAGGEEQAEIVLATDGQWVEETEPMGLAVPVSVLPVEHSAGGSPGIIRFGVASARSDNSGEDGASGLLYNAVASVKNWGSEAAEATAFVYAGNSLAASETVLLAPGEERFWSFGGLPSANWYKLELTAASDIMPADNTAYAFPAAEGGRTVLLVGESNLFLEKALQLVQTNIIYAQKSDGGYSLPRSQVDLIVLNRVSEDGISSQAWQKLLAEKPVWSIGGSLGAGREGQPAGDVWAEEHPVMKDVRWDQVHVSQSFAPEGQELAAVLAQGEWPLVLAGGAGEVRRLAFAFQLEDTDLPLRPDFPILIRNAVSWLTELSGEALGTGIAGQPLELSFLPEAASAVWETVEAAGKTEPASRSSEGFPASAPAGPGLYRLVEQDEAGLLLRMRYYSVFSDIREADPERVTDFGFLGAGAGGEPVAKAGAETPAPPYDLAPWLIAAILLVLLVEWEVYRRGNTI